MVQTVPARVIRFMAVAVVHTAGVSLAPHAVAEDILKLRSRSDLALIEMIHPDPRSTRPPRAGVSDLAVVIAGDRAGRVLALADGAAPGSGRTAFRIRLLVVSEGRLLADGIGACGPWRRGVTRCEMECDGGYFRLRRTQGAVDEADLVLGGESDSLDANHRSISLGNCELEGEPAPRLTVKAGRNLVELPLLAD